MTTDNTAWDFDNLSQQQLAECFGVDRTTIRNRQLAGMPHNPPAGKGRKASYVLGVAMYWHLGNEAAKKASYKLTEARKILFGYLLASDDKRLDTVGLMEKAGFTDNTQVLIDLGYVYRLIE